MIIKSTSRKAITSRSSRFAHAFEEALHYVNRGSQQEQPTIFHNLDTNRDHLPVIAQEFWENYDQYHSKQKNRVVLFHEFLSFAIKDRQSLLDNPEILIDIGQKWAELRAMDALGYGKVHVDQEHIHIHFVFSGNRVGSSRQLRVTKQEFKALQHQLECYQRDRYPHLEHSDFYSPGHESQKGKRSNAEQEKYRREKNEILLSGKKTVEKRRLSLCEKDKAAELVRECLSLSVSQSDLRERLKTVGLVLYRRGKAFGVKDLKTNRKHRLKTLGVLKEFGKIISHKKDKELLVIDL